MDSGQHEPKQPKSHSEERNLLLINWTGWLIIAFFLMICIISGFVVFSNIEDKGTVLLKLISLVGVLFALMTLFIKYYYWNEKRSHNRFDLELKIAHLEKQLEKWNHNCVRLHGKPCVW